MKKILMFIFAIGMVLGFNSRVFAATVDLTDDPDIYSTECQEEDADCNSDTSVFGEDDGTDSETCENCDDDTDTVTENPKTAGEATFIIGALGSLGAAKVFISANNKKKKM